MRFNIILMKKNTKRRDELQIKMDVLRVIRDESTPTRVMYSCNLSSVPFAAIQKSLSESGLINLNQFGKSGCRRRVKCELTVRGHQTLKAYDHLIVLMGGSGIGL